jgi:amino acid adenylation domain-containing protein
MLVNGSCHIESEYPLLPMQQGILFHTLSGAGSDVYVGQFVCELDETLDVNAFQRAWQCAVERHAVLRTALRYEGLKEPLQQVYSNMPLDFQISEWQQDETALDHYLLAERQRGFNLTRPPLMRFVLLKKFKGKYLFIWTHHHILLDGRSRLTVLKDVSRFYEAFAHGAGLELPQPPSFQRYVDWSRRQDTQDAEKYWKKLLEDFTASVPFSSSSQGAQVSSAEQYGSNPLQLPPSLEGNLQKVAHQHKVTLNILIQAAWAALLTRYGAEADEVVFGETRACRRPAFEDVGAVVGVLMNTVPIRLKNDPSQTFKALITDLRSHHVGLRDHESASLVDIKKWCNLSDRKHLFESIVVFEEYDLGSALQREGCSLWRGKVRRIVHTHYPITLSGFRKPQLQLELASDRQMVSDITARRIAGHLLRLLTAISVDPGAQIGEVSLLDSEEQQQVLKDWNQTWREYPCQSGLHTWFEQQVIRTPEKIAIVDHGERLTYAELNALSNQVAHDLRQWGVGPEVRVGVCMERSLRMIAVLLGILKAGGAYVPLDPAYPPERVKFMLEDAAVSLVFSEEALASRFSGLNTRLLCVEQHWEQVRQRSTANPAVPVDGDNIAYLIFTSGSTGRPKGVAIRHRSADILIHWARENFSAKELESVLASTSICFDLSVFEIFVPLSWGGKIVLASNALELEEIGRSEPVTLVNTVPSAMAELVRLNALPASVHTVNLAGEALGRTLVNQIYAKVKRVCNLYGPSEDTTYSTYVEVSREKHAEVTIGLPLANTAVYVLGENLQPQPIGVAGELYITGEGLARGYWARPELTAERFIPNPYNAQPGVRMYRTGDRVCRREDGGLKYLGRVDYQVKVRGYRIELGEIEAVLGQHQQVRQAVVVVREDARGDKRIIAYVAGDVDQISVETLRRHVGRCLPDYMVPSHIMALPELPLTPNGKVDRKALPAVDWGREGVNNECAAPANAIEELLVNIWSEVLGIRSVTMNDNFFQRGGHSLLAMQVVARLRSSLGMDLPVRQIFETPTPAGLAASLKQVVRQEAQQPEANLQVRNGNRQLPLSFAQQRLWFLQQFAEDQALYNITTVVRLHGQLDVQALQQAIEEIVRRHQVLRTSYSNVDGGPVQVVHETAEVVLPVLDLTEFSQQEKKQREQQRIAEEGRKGFDLTGSPLLRTVLVRTGEQEHVLVLTMHHIVSDGWSQQVFTSELAELYRACLNGRKPQLPELPMQYADYALWQREWLQGEALQKQLGYWRERLQGIPELLELSIAMPRGAVQSHAGRQHRFQIGEALLQQLKDLSREQGVTLFMTLLSGFQLLLQRYSGQSDIVVGSPIAGRTLKETENLIGLFVNTLVLRTEVRQDATVRELLRQVREVALGAYGNQDVPFEKLVEELQVARDMSRTPLFQVVFVFQNTPPAEWDLQGLKGEEQPVDRGFAKFDLMLELAERGGKLHGVFSYRSELYVEGAIQRLAAHLEKLLAEMAFDPRAQLGGLNMLGAQEERLLLEQWRGPEISYPSGFIHELFERQTVRTPEAVALMCNGAKVSYAELDRHSSQLAHYLMKLGVRTETCVALYMQRSLEMVIAMLGVLKAGATYVALDPDYPQQRLNFILEDTEAPVVLTQNRLMGQLQAFYSGTPVQLDADWQQIAEQPATRPPISLDPENLAYIIYTSGSTGRPKGVGIRHGSAAEFVHWSNQVFTPNETACVLASSSICFDLSIFEIFVPLSRGGRVLIVQNALELSRAAEAGLVTLINTVPSAIAALLNMNGVPQSVKVVNLAGEALDAALAQQIYRRTNVDKVFNLYGPSEDTTYSTFTALPAKRALTTVSIGKPIANTQVYVLDSSMNCVPLGVAGELYISGHGLARGYLNRPDLTADRFVPSPFGSDQGTRMYRTGDLARWNIEGDLEFLGRIDNQVKLRGYRIELGEIEAALREIEGVRDVVVVLGLSSTQDQSIIAYLVARDDISFSEEHVRSTLRTKLPPYMLPSAYIFLRELPRTPNGKMDRKALPEPEIVSSNIEAIAPRTDTERTICAAWEEVLKREHISIEQNFFQIGGHSLRAMQVISRLQSIFSIDLPVTALFHWPTIGELAARIDEQTSRHASRRSQVQIQSNLPLEHVLAGVDGLSEEEVEMLLAMEEPNQ